MLYVHFAGATFVFSQMTELSKCFLTNVTCVRFLASMNAFVCCQTAARSKRIITYVTRVWFDTSVKAFMSNQLTVPSERFITNVTATHIRLMTHITFMCFVSSVCFMRGGISVHLFTCVTVVYTFYLLNICTSEHHMASIMSTDLI